jgi:hypothetical protein
MVRSTTTESNMAASKNRPDDKGKVRIRFMEVELEGSNETLLEGIRSITAAMPSSTTHTRVLQKQLPPRSQPTQLASAPPGELDGGEDSERTSEDLDEVADDCVTEQREQPKRTRAQRAPKAPQLSENLRMDEQPMPFSEFCEGTAIAAESSIMDKAIVIATWLKEHRQQDSMSASDLFTCCKFMDWAPPADVTSPMRNLKHDKKMNSAGRGLFTLTVLGDKHFRNLKK